MTDLPILFSAPMVRALLDGRKTQTRRVLKPAPFIDAMGNFCAMDRKGKLWNYGQRLDGKPCLDHYTEKCVRFRNGDRLWVRESAWYDPAVCQGLNGLRCFFEGTDVRHQFAGPTMTAPFASTDELFKVSKEQVRRPGIHMPRWASRLTLTVTDVRVQRLQECSEADAIAEGIEGRAVIGGNAWRDYGGGDGFNVRDPGRPAVRSYASLWDSINGADSWAANPWIVALTFTVERRNIDELPPRADLP